MTYTVRTLGAGLILAATLTASQAVAQVPPSSPASAAAALASAEDRVAIEALIEQFKAAIVAKDKPGMALLFYDGVVIWRGSLHPSSRAAYARMSPEPVKIVQNEGAYDFLDDPRIAGVAIEERIYNPVIRSDGQIATVTFGYDFRAQGQIQNWGDESWQLVKTDEGWKILHLLFSGHLQMVNPAPELR